MSGSAAIRSGGPDPAALDPHMPAPALITLSDPDPDPTYCLHYFPSLGPLSSTVALTSDCKFAELSYSFILINVTRVYSLTDKCGEYLFADLNVILVFCIFNNDLTGCVYNLRSLIDFAPFKVGMPLPVNNSHCIVNSGSSYILNMDLGYLCVGIHYM